MNEPINPHFAAARDRVLATYDSPPTPIATSTNSTIEMSDLEALEAVAKPGQNADGTFPYLEGYDDPP